MVARAAPKRRTWPLWLLGLAMLLLVSSILLMQRSYRQQLEASMAQLQHSVAVARLQQERLAARLHDRPPPGSAAGSKTASAEVAPAERTQPAPAVPMDQAAALAGRLQRVASEMHLLARDGGATAAASPGEWLDWSRVRAELWSISRALRQTLPSAARRNDTNRASLRDWVSRAQSAANQERAAALIAALRGIEQQIAAQGRGDPDAERLARRTSRLASVLGAGGLSAVDRQRLSELAQETSAIAQRVSTLAADSAADHGTTR